MKDQFKKLPDLSDIELINYEQEINNQIIQNVNEFKNRYPNSTSSYGDSINDDYNGNNDDYNELINLKNEIEKEKSRRISQAGKLSAPTKLRFIHT